MGLRESIRQLVQITAVRLDEAHDYYHFTKLIWDELDLGIGAGRQFTYSNPTTGSTINERGLLQLRLRHLRDYVAPMTLGQFVSIFEDFFFDLSRLWLAAFPGNLAGRDLKFRLVLDSPDKDAIPHAVIDKELNELKYERVVDWFTYVDRRLKIPCPTADDIEILAEIKASRDILSHNEGVVNAIYVMKSGPKARFADGERMVLPDPYLRESWQLLKRLAEQFGTAAVAQAPPG